MCRMNKFYDDYRKNTVILAMQEVKAAAGEKVIAQGDDGDFLFAIDVSNPDIVIATEVYNDYSALEDHFKTAQWDHFSGVMEEYPPRNLDMKTYEAFETKHALDD